MIKRMEIIRKSTWPLVQLECAYYMLKNVLSPSFTSGMIGVWSIEAGILWRQIHNLFILNALPNRLTDVAAVRYAVAEMVRIGWLTAKDDGEGFRYTFIRTNEEMSQDAFIEIL